MATKAEQIAQLNKELEQDVAYLPLVQSAQDIVPGEGNPEAEIMFIGEAAGRNEAIQRRPFVGVAGQLLDKTLAENGFQRKDVYISNVVKTRPPENRDPLQEEIEAFRPYLDKEIEIIDPTLIITLGRFSMGKFIPGARISHIHGRLHKVKFIGKYRYILPFYHPAAALRQQVVLDQFQKDFTKIKKILEYISKKKEETTFLENIEETLLS